MLSIFAFPKPFHGHIGVIQRNAIGSWMQLKPRCEIFLFGNEEGTAEVARELGACHVPDIARNEFGTPLLSDVFQRGEQLATQSIHSYVNCDIVLGREFISAVKQVSATNKRFLMVGQCCGLEVKSPIQFEQSKWEEHLKDLVCERGEMRGLAAIDYFVFPRGLYQTLPPFALGRAKFDNWLVWRARNLKVPVVDATPSVLAIHQNHDYFHVAGGKDYTLYGEEAMRNLKYAGGEGHCYEISDATHKLLPTGISWNWQGYLRMEFRKARVQAWKTRMTTRIMIKFWRLMEASRIIRHAMGLNAKNWRRLRNVVIGERKFQ